jgi:hypothetical protein
MNPEFRRNLWLELTKERLIAMPAIIGFGALIFANISDASKVGWVAWSIAVLFGLIWGTRLSTASIVREVSGRTWDAQRASALSGWQMTWAKLAGSTLAPWYGIALLFVAWLLANEAGASRKDWIVLVLSCVLAQAAALGMALLLLQDRRAPIRSGVPHFFGAVAGLAVLHYTGFVSLIDRRGDLAWFGLQPGSDVVEVGSLVFLTVWAVVAAWRAMAQALQIPMRPWAWPLFVLTLGVWLAGLAPDSFGRDLPQARIALAFAAALAMTWLAVLIDPKSPVALRRWQAALRGPQRANAIALAPPWTLGLPIVIVLAIGTAIALERASGLLVIASLMLFLARDIALMHFVALTGKPGRGVSVLIYLAVLYGLVPTALGALGWKALLPAFIPVPPVGPAAPALLLLGIQVLLAAALAWRAMRRFDRKSVAES